MTSLAALRNRLDTQFDRVQKQTDDIALRIANRRSVDAGLIDDLHAFNKSMMQTAVAQYCVGEEAKIKHNLAKVIINEIR